MPDRMPNRMSEDMSDRMPEDLPVRKCINVMVGITRSKVISLQMGFSNRVRLLDTKSCGQFSQPHFSDPQRMFGFMKAKSQPIPSGKQT